MHAAMWLLLDDDGDAASEKKNMCRQHEKSII